jgi:ribonuclease D
VSPVSGDWHLVCDAGSLESTCQRAASAPVLYLDTEFERTRTFHARLALVQISDGDATSLLDTTVIDELAPLARLIDRDGAVTVMHAPAEDLEILEHALGSVPGHLFDTQIAAALCGYGGGLGYQRLVQALFQEEISKAATRSDWMRRPLSPEQLRYAAMDVAYLPPAHARLEEELRALDRRGWLDEEMTLLLDRVREPEASRDLHKLARRVGPDDAALARLAALCGVREARARERDIPRRRVVDDTMLLDLATDPPESLDALRARLGRGSGGRAPRPAFLEAVYAGLNASPVPRPVSAEDLRPYRRPLARMRDVVAGVAAQLGIPDDLLASRRLLEQLLVSQQLRGQGPPREFLGWRRDTILEPLCQVLEAEN